MLNERGVRDQLAEVRSALGKLDAERTALEAIEGSLVRWLDLHGESHAQLPLAATQPSNGAVRSASNFKALGTISLAKAVIRALRNRAGIPMKTDEVLSAAINMGAVTKAKRPDKLVEWVLYDALKKKTAPIKRAKAPHTWIYQAPAVEPEQPSAFEILADT